MNVGTPHTVCESTYDVCSFSTVGQRASAVDLGPQRVDVGAGGGEHRRQIGRGP